MTSSSGRRCSGCGCILSRFNDGSRCGTCSRDQRLRPAVGLWDLPDVRRALANWEISTIVSSYRRHTGATQAAIGAAVGTDQSEVSRIERGHKQVRDRQQLLAWTRALGVPDHLLGALPGGEPSDTATVELLGAPSPGVGQLLLPPGVGLATNMVPTLTVAAQGRHGAMIELETDSAIDPWLRTPMRTMIIATQDVDDQTKRFAIDAGSIADVSTRTGVKIRIPAAYELDDLTFGILWAVAGFDAALLGDDTALGEVLPLASAADLDPLSEAVRRQRLSAGSLMLLGSQACADFILERRASVADDPIFWTREQRGEEAATWLLFKHKLAYLRSTAPRRPDSRTGRAFCIPQTQVETSPKYERVLLFLAIALMESLGIRTWVTADSGFSETDGFVLIPGRRAVIANWVRAEAVSQLALTAKPTTLRTFADAAGQVSVKPLNGGQDPQSRLSALAEYFRLDHGWLGRRCTELAEHGTAGLARPRSRLLSTEGLDAACRYVAAQYRSTVRIPGSATR